jgi:hypothetical protein
MTKCSGLECTKEAIFGLSKTDPKKYCKNHKTPEMTDVRNKKCLNCNKIPLFNFKGLKERLYCNEHKQPDMVNIVHRTCKEGDCKVQASYNVEGKYADYCEKHKTEEMIKVIYGKKCEKEGCKLRPSFNYEGEKSRIYCTAHKLDGMICIDGIFCQDPDCKINANYNYEGLKPIYCTTHKKPNMIDVCSPHCKTPLCYTRVTKKNEGYCMFCFIHTFPDRPIAKNYKSRESATIKYLMKEFPDFTWISDKRVQNGCSARRPDLLLDLGYQVIIVEIDEDQHRGYICSCENKRTMELSKDVNHRPIVFIRFNPDAYTKLDGTVVKSCWGLNSKGLFSVKKNKNVEWSNRLKTLEDQVTFWSKPENTTNKTIECIQLYYS